MAEAKPAVYVRTPYHCTQDDSPGRLEAARALPARRDLRRRDAAAEEALAAPRVVEVLHRVGHSAPADQRVRLIAREVDGR